MIKFAIKTSLVGGAIYVTKEQNVWGNSKLTTELFNNINSMIKPYANDAMAKVPIELPLLPASGELCFVTNHYYNKSVKSTFYFIHRLPCYIGQYAKKGKDAIKSAFEAKPDNLNTTAHHPIDGKIKS